MFSNSLTAILIDGGFFLKRYRWTYGAGELHDPQTVANNLYTMAHQHREESELYRIYYYDCPPFTKSVENPVTGEAVNFAESDQAIFRTELFDALRRKRKVALRFGHLQDGHSWQLRPAIVEKLLNEELAVDDISSEDVVYNLRQKGVDIKIGIDIASLALKRLVRRIVLVSGDPDFIPAAKLARREGIDFVLDPMWNPIDSELFEHIDGLKSFCPRPNS